MPGNRSRALIAAAAASALLIVALTVPAHAEDPPSELVWTPMPGFPVTTADDVTVLVETAVVPKSDFALLNDFPVQRVLIENDSLETRYFGFGIDIETEGVIEPLWIEQTWGDFGSPGQGFMTVMLEPGQSTADGSDVYTGPYGLPGIPLYPGRTGVVYELSSDPSEALVPTGNEIARTVRTPGDFTPVRLDADNTQDGTPPVGQELTIVGSPVVGDVIQLFPGVTGTVEASGLPAARTLELWLAPGTDYFWSTVLGGMMLDTAVPVGTATTSATGILSAPFHVPADVDLSGNYRVFAGDPDTNSWLAATYRSFAITAPDDQDAVVASPSATTALLDLGLTSVDFAFPMGTGGTWSGSVSTTGPVASGFTLAGNVPLYFHLDTTADLGGAEVEVCFTYPVTNIPGDPPHLFHLTAAPGGGFTWRNITTSRTISGESGVVCGLTSSFSPFALGYPDQFDFDGFFSPVSMDAENIAKPGQAIPVKFSLNGDQGLEIVESARFVTEGAATSFVGEVVAATTVGSSGLTYDAARDQYTYVWKTPKTLSLKTGLFELTLSDGSVHSFNVTFRK